MASSPNQNSSSGFQMFLRFDNLVLRMSRRKKQKRLPNEMIKNTDNPKCRSFGKRSNRIRQRAYWVYTLGDHRLPFKIKQPISAFL